MTLNIISQVSIIKVAICSGLADSSGFPPCDPGFSKSNFCLEFRAFLPVFQKWLGKFTKDIKKQTKGYFFAKNNFIQLKIIDYINLISYTKKYYI